MVSQRGFLINSFYCSKERQRELLKAEGVFVAAVGENGSYRVEDFAYRRFDFRNMRITVLKTDALSLALCYQNDRDERVEEAIEEMLKDYWEGANG